MNLNGEIMSKDAVAATVQDSRITTSNTALLPLYLRRTGDVEGWLRDRAIDGHRTNSRLLKKALRLASADDIEVVLKVNAATITDTYWFRESGSALVYEDVRFKTNLFDKLALQGDPDSFNQPYSRTPELTNIGSFEKCWRLVDGEWWMVKQGSELERFSELFICRLGQALGFPMADYQPEGDTIKSPDFTRGASVNYEAADGIVGSDEDYGLNFDALYAMAPKLAEQYLQIIYMDTLCFNMDRHTKNYGILRDAGDGRILSMAPNFDNNIALFARGIPQKLERMNDKLIALFLELLERDSRALTMAQRLPVPSASMLEQCIDAIPITIDRQAVCAFVMNGSAQMQALIQSLVQDPGIGIRM